MTETNPKPHFCEQCKEDTEHAEFCRYQECPEAKNFFQLEVLRENQPESIKSIQEKMENPELKIDKNGFSVPGWAHTVIKSAIEKRKKPQLREEFKIKNSRYQLLFKWERDTGEVIVTKFVNLKKEAEEAEKKRKAAEAEAKAKENSSTVEGKAEKTEKTTPTDEEKWK